MADTVFHKILRNEIPSTREYEDDTCIVIHNIDPKAPVHLLVIPKTEIVRVGEMKESDKEVVGHLIWVARQVAEKLNIVDNFKIIINSGEKVSHVPYLHVHVIGGWKDISPEDYEV